MKNFFFVLLIAISSTVFCQNFEGKIVYESTYKSKSFLISDNKLKDMMGDIQESFYKDDRYINKLNGKMIEWQLYNPADNKLYTKSSLSDVVYWNNGGENNDEIKSIKINRNSARVLGHKCNEVVLECKSGTQKYYFAEGIMPMNHLTYQKHQFGNWHAYLKEANALPLKIIIETPQFVMETTAKEIISQKVDEKIFNLPENTKTEKAPF